MATPLKILLYPDKRLRQCASIVPKKSLKNPEWLEKINQMMDLLDFSGGAALAATQVGWNERVFIQKATESSGSVRVFINPFYRGIGHRVLQMEGCLSFPGIFKKVLRFPSVDAWYMDVDGRPYRETLHGFNAHVFQHETDHLFGTLFIDYINKEDRQDVEDQILWNDKRLRYISLMAQQRS